MTKNNRSDTDSSLEELRQTISVSSLSAASLPSRTDGAPRAAHLLGLPSKVRRQMRLTKWIIFLERCYNAAWPGAGPIGVFAAISMLDLWRFLPGWLGLPLAAGLFLLGGYWLVRDGRKLAWPTQAEAIRRLDETAAKAGVRGHPLSAYADDLAGSSVSPTDRGTAHLWSLHRERLEAQLQSLRLERPRTSLARRDPMALRFAVLLFLTLGLFLTWGVGNSWRGLTVLVPGNGGSAGAQVVAWVAPPDYTRVPPIYLTQPGNDFAASPREDADAVRGSADPIPVPSGSVFFARVESRSQPRLQSRSPDRVASGFFDAVANLFKPADTSLSGALAAPVFSEVEEGVYEVSLILDRPVHLDLRVGMGRGHSWSFKAIDDQKPAIGFSDEPGATKQFALSAPYVMLDDYGVTAAQVVLRRMDIPDDEQIPLADVLDRRQSEAEDASNGDTDKVENGDRSQESQWTEFDVWLKGPAVLDLDLKDLRPTRKSGTFVQDLTAHPWAGMEVNVQLRAVDDLAQAGFSETRRLTLPERPFKAPLARAVIEQRQNLVRRSEDAATVARALDALIEYPEIYQPGARVYLGLRVAAKRLEALSDPETLRDVHGMLWDIALQIEDGGRQRMAEQLRNLQQRLSDAIEEGRPQDEIDQIMKALQDMIGDYLAKLMENSLDALENGELPPFEFDGQMMSDSDLKDLLDAIEDMLRTGNIDGAMEALAQLMDTLEGMQFALPFGGSGSFPFSMPGDQKVNEALSELGEIINRQRNLMDETFRQNQGNRNETGDPGQQGQSPGQQDQPQTGQPGSSSDTEDLRAGQEGLRRSLEDSLDALKGEGGEVPQELERAERAMREAERSLEQGNADEAVKQQQDAIDQLREGTQSLAQDMLDERMKQMGRNGEGESGGEAREFDPLGRPTARTGPEFGDSVDVPDKSELQRAREILDELRRRAGERDRPKPELDYLERLLPRF